MDYAARRQRVKLELEQTGLDALLVTRLTNIRYLSGFSGSMAFLFIAAEPALVVDFRYRAQAAVEAAGTTVHHVTSSREVWPRTRRMLGESGYKRVGVEAAHLNLAQFLELSKIPDVELVPTHNLVERMRARKDPDEIKALREAVRIADEAAEEIL